MPLYRKKPVVIEAEQYLGDFSVMEHWAQAALFNGDILAVPNDNGNVFIANDHYVLTLEGMMKIDYGDYLIKGIKGELYPCKADIFEATYDSVEEEEE